MNVPGLSLFQGGGSIQLNTSAQQRIEEEDALEDQKRRDEELKNELQNAFDDLDDTDDDEGESRLSTDLSLNLHARNDERHGQLHLNGGNMMHNNHQANGQFTNNILNGIGSPSPTQCNVAEHEQLLVEIKYLKNAFSSKESEVKNITSMAAGERGRLESSVNELKKRLAISEAEKERAHMNRNQEHELLVEAKKHIAEQSNEMTELNVKIKSLDAKNFELLTDLEHTRTMLSDVQHKYHMVDRNAVAEKRVDATVRQINEQHAAQVDMMQQQINTMTTKLEGRENELKRLQIQCNELQCSREAMLIDKSDTINRLTQQLEASQRQCQNIIMKSSSSAELEQEVLQLRRMVSSSEQQMTSMQRTISNLTTRLETTTAELELMTDSAIVADTSSPNIKNLSTPTGRPRDPLRKCTIAGNSSTPIVVEDRLQRFKQEFNRCLADQREKRLEILQLKEQLSARNDEIQQLKVDENKALVEWNTHKETSERLTNKLKTAESELAALRRRSPSHTRSLNDISRKSQGVDHSSVASPPMQKQLEEMTTRNDELQKLLEEKMKECAIHTDDGPLKESRDECLRLKNLYMALSSEKDELMRELAKIRAFDVHKELSEQNKTIVALQKALDATELKCDELNKMLESEKQNAHDKIEELKMKLQRDHGHDASELSIRHTASCRKCIELSTKNAQVEIENLQIQTSCSNYLKEIHDLKKSLKQSERVIADLEKHSILKIEHDQLIEDLKKKAERFEEFMLNNNLSPTKKRSVETNTPSLTDRSIAEHMRDQCVSTEDLLTNEENSSRSGSNISPTSAEYRAIEKRIREEMSRVMANKIKTYENQLKAETIRFNEQMKLMADELEETQVQLKSREHDVSALKQCILSERATIRQVLEKKDLEAELALEKQQDMLIRGRDQLQAAQQQIEQLHHELNNCTTQMHNERQNMEKLIEQCDDERRALMQRENNLRDQMARKQKEYHEETEMLRDKVVAAKKTAASYKQYSEDKERHIKKESERIQQAYESAVQKVKDRMTDALKEQEKKQKQQIAQLESKYELLKTPDSRRHTSSTSSQSNSRQFT